MAIRTIAPKIFVHERPQRFYGIEVGARRTVIALDGGLLLHSPTDADPSEIETIGTPKWLLAPNKLHHLYAGAWLDRELRGWCAPGLPQKRPDLSFEHVVSQECTPFADEVLLVPNSSFAMTNEVVLLHRPSRTLVLTDLVFNVESTAPWMTMAGGCPGCSTTILEQVGMNRSKARIEIARILELDFDRVIPSHGAIIETDGKDAVRHAFRWLGSLGG